MIQKGEAAQRRRLWTVGRLSGVWPSARGLLHPAGSSGHGTIPKCQTSLAWSLLRDSTMGRSRFGRCRQVGCFWYKVLEAYVPVLIRGQWGHQPPAGWGVQPRLADREPPLPLTPPFTVGLLLLNLSGHQDVVRDLSFTPSGSLILVSASRDKTLRIWDLNKHGTNSRATPQILCPFLHQGHFYPE